ncbi:MAG: hypothetical protein WBH77_10035 [Saccharofermentanales bacterium]
MDTLSFIVAITSVAISLLGPIVSSCISAKSQIKLKNLDVYENRKWDNLEKYYMAVSGTLTTPGLTKEFGKYHNIIFMYAPIEIHSDINKLHKIAYDAEIDNEEALNEARKLLSKIITICTPESPSPSIFRK